MRYFRALDTFTGLEDLPGGPVRVVKGDVRPESDVAVRHDVANGGRLFVPLHDDEESAPPAPASRRGPRTRP